MDMLHSLRNFTDKLTNLFLVGSIIRIISIVFPFGVYSIVPLVFGLVVLLIVSQLLFGTSELFIGGIIIFTISYFIGVCSTPFKKAPKRTSPTHSAWNILYRRVPHLIFVSTFCFFMLYNSVSITTLSISFIAVWFAVRKTTKAYEQDVKRTIVSNNPLLLFSIRMCLFSFIFAGLIVIFFNGLLAIWAVPYITVLTILGPPVGYLLFRYLYSWKLGVGMIPDTRLDPENNQLINFTVPEDKMETYVTARKQVRDTPIIKLISKANFELSKMEDPPIDSITNPALNIGFDEVVEDINEINSNLDETGEYEAITKLVEFAEVYETVMEIENERQFDTDLTS